MPDAVFICPPCDIDLHDLCWWLDDTENPYAYCVLCTAFRARPVEDDIVSPRESGRDWRNRISESVDEHASARRRASDIGRGSDDA